MNYIDTIDYSKLAEQITMNIEAKLSNEKINKEWKQGLPWVMDKDNKKIINHIQNYELFVQNHPKYANKLKYNEFLQRPELDGKIFDDAALNYLYRDCEIEIGLSSMSNMDKIVKMLPITNSYNPVIDYIKECGKKWDKKERVENLFIDLLEADDTELNKKMTMKWMMAAVKRVLHPGCKFDNILILQGGQGIGKSTICEKLSNNFFSQMSIEEIGNKDIIDKMNKSWIMIADEMDSFTKKEMSAIKSFLSVTKDSARLAYGKMVNEYPRHCVFIGSINDETFLRDTSSPVERRFWIIKCNKKEMDSKISEYLTQETVDQIWGEAYNKFIENENVYLDIEKELQQEFAETMNQFKTSNDDDGIVIIKQILDKKYVLNEKGEFPDMYDFFRQVKGEYQLHNNTITANNYINKIPTTWLSQLLKIEHKIDRKGKFIAQGLQSEWEYKNCKYKGQTTKAIVRLNPIKLEKEEVIEGLPF